MKFCIFYYCCKIVGFPYLIKIKEHNREKIEVRGVFLDISKAFDRVWHDGLIFKLQENSISGKLLLLKDFLKSRKQRLVLTPRIDSGTPPLSSLY